MARLMRVVKTYWLSGVLTALGLGLSIYLQYRVFWSPMLLSEDLWRERLDFHLTWSPFAVRFFQSYFTLGLHNLFGWSVKYSFFFVQFSLTLALGPVFYRYLRQLDINRVWAHAGVVLLMTAYPILGAHFEPTHTWDDIWSYLFLVLMMTALLKNRWTQVALFLTLGFFAREQVLLIYPVLLLTAWWFRERTRLTVSLTCLAVPIVAYSLFRVLVWEDIDPQRWRLFEFNFENGARITDSVISAIIAFGFMWLTGLIGTVRLATVKRTVQDRFLVYGGLVFVTLTVLFTLTLSFARETRIFFPAFVFIIPLTVLTLQRFWHFARQSWHPIHWILVLATTVSLAWAGIEAAETLRWSSDYKVNAEFRVPLAGGHLGIMVAILLAYINSYFRRLYLWGETSASPDSRVFRSKNFRRWLATSIILAISALVLWFGVFIAAPIVRGPQLTEIKPTPNHVFGESVKLTRISVEEKNGMTVAILFDLSVLSKVSETHKMFLHLKPVSADSVIKLDFIPDPHATLWMPGNTYTMRRALDVDPGMYKVSTGLFNTGGRMGRPYTFYALFR